MKPLNRARRAGTAAALGILLAGSAARAESVEDFYKSRTVTILVGNTAGGGYDLTARLLARHMAKYIPGHPTMVVQNMPGAATIKEANYLYAIAPKNGSVIGTVARGTVVEPLFSAQQFDGTKYAWLGSVARSVSTCLAWKTSPIKSWPDVMRREYTVAGQGPSADADVFALTLKHLFAAKIKLVTGFPGTAEMALAMERGEVDGFCGMSYTTLKARHGSWLSDGSVTILLQAGLDRDPALKDVPLITDLTTDKDKLRTVRLIVATQGMALPFAAPPGTPEDRVAGLRAAFDATMRDSDFIAEAKELEVEVSPMTGAAVAALVDELYATPKDIVAEAASAMAAAP